MGLQVVLVEELPMEFWSKSRTKCVFGRADARKPMFFHTKSVPEPRWSTSAVRRLRDGLVCGRIMFGSWSDRFRIVNGVSSVFRACAVDRIPLWFATVGSFPQCKWDCKWCWWRSCRWSFDGSLARNAFLRDSRCTKAYVFPYKVRPRTSMIYLCIPFCQQIFSILALVIFLLKILLKSASKSSFFRSGVEIRFWSYNFRRHCA